MRDRNATTHERARQRAAEKGVPSAKRRAPSRLVEGAVTQGWRAGALLIAFPDRLEPHIR